MLILKEMFGIATGEGLTEDSEPSWGRPKDRVWVSRSRELKVVLCEDLGGGNSWLNVDGESYMIEEVDTLRKEREQDILRQFTTDYSGDKLSSEKLEKKMIGIFELRLFIFKMKSSLNKPKLDGVNNGES